MLAAGYAPSPQCPRGAGVGPLPETQGHSAYLTDPSTRRADTPYPPSGRDRRAPTERLEMGRVAALRRDNHG